MRDRPDERSGSRRPRPHSRTSPPSRASRPPGGKPQSREREPEERIAPARYVAFRALLESEQRQIFADRRLRELFASGNLKREDRALATLLVQETLRRRAELDYLILKLLDKGFSSIAPPVMQALRLGLVQIIYLDRVPDHAAVDESVKMTRNSGYPERAGVVNAILRRASRGDLPAVPAGDDDLSLAIRYSFPVWLVRRWRRLGDGFRSALEGSNRTPDLVLRVNSSRTTPTKVLRDLEAINVHAEPGRLASTCIRVRGRFDLTHFPGFISGEVSVQDESEALVCDMVDPLPTERILDACAAPGGKTGHMLERTDGLARLTAMDLSPTRLRMVAENLERTRFQADLIAGDGRFPPLRSRFDRVLVDAPCSGTGVLARRAEARWRLDSSDPARCAERQILLLDALSKLVATGGLLVYSVCSVEQEETSDVVERFLHSHPRFREEPAASLPQRARDPLGRLFILPGGAGSDGVFGVRFRRVR